MAHKNQNKTNKQTAEDGMVTYLCNFSTWEAKVGGLLQV